MVSTPNSSNRVIIKCTNCTGKLRVPVGKVGTIPCPHCHTEFEADTRSNEDTYTSNKPKDYDVVLGGKSLIPVNGVVLGGLEGVKHRLESEEEDIRIAALSEARKYGKAGLYLIISALKDPSLEVFQASYSYLKNETELDAKEVLQKALPLNSSANMDYSKLRDFLIDEKWLEADKETANLLLKTCNRQKKGWLRPEADLGNFPCQDLHTIDQLWVKLSGGKFGFSVQAEIWERLGNNFIDTIAFDSPRSDMERKQIKQVWRNFGEIVGWRINDRWKEVKELNFNLKAKTGHLPMPIIHWHFNGVAYGVLPGQALWKFTFWVSTGFGTEGNSKMSQSDLWIAFLLNRVNQCSIDS